MARSWRKHFSDRGRFQKAIGGISKQKKKKKKKKKTWCDKTLQCRLDNFKPFPGFITLSSHGWTHTLFFFWVWWTGFSEQTSQDLFIDFNFATYLASFSLVCLRLFAFSVIYSLWSHQASQARGNLHIHVAHSKNSPSLITRICEDFDTFLRTFPATLTHRLTLRISHYSKENKEHGNNKNTGVKEPRGSSSGRIPEECGLARPGVKNNLAIYQGPAVVSFSHAFM